MKHASITKLFSGIGLGLALIGTTLKADEVKTVYTMDNAAAGNHVLIFQQDEHTALHAAGSVATGGSGTGGGLSDQGSVILSHDGKWLFVNHQSPGITFAITGPWKEGLL